jgi:hypothetical protein
MSLALRGQFKGHYIPCTMMTNNAIWERGWFYLRNAEPGLPPYTGRVFMEKPSSWGYGVSTAQHRRWQDSVLAALRSLSEQGLTAMGVLAFHHHRRVVPLMERPLCIFEMIEEADPIALARSRMLPAPLGRPYALTRARSAVDTRVPAHPHRTPWDLEMLPTGPLVSMILGSVSVLGVASAF